MEAVTASYVVDGHEATYWSLYSVREKRLLSLSGATK